MDMVSPKQRHANMAAIQGKDTKPEMAVRRYLWGQGFCYRLNHPRLPGKPGIVMRKYRTCIFVNGCFWHGHGVAMQKNENGELKILTAVRFRRLTGSSGWRRYGGIRSGIKKYRMNLRRWAGNPSPFGNVN